ncbi:MAG: Bro-N domain-containing protein [Cyclobacteriaceae bacterium]|nr:Bro-N domain-containing protein [Cyclobacteriaceae bacterium]
MKNLFKYNDQPLFVITENEEPTFKAQDLAKILEYSSTQMALKILDDDEKLFNPSDYSGQKRKTWFVTESGFFHLVIKSTKPEAKHIRKWVTSVVLPALRKGIYGKDASTKKLVLTDEIRREWDILLEKIKIKEKELHDLKSDVEVISVNFWNTYRMNPNQLNLFEPETPNHA